VGQKARFKQTGSWEHCLGRRSNLMTRYFFDIREGDKVAVDEEEKEFPRGGPRGSGALIGRSSAGQDWLSPILSDDDRSARHPQASCRSQIRLGNAPDEALGPPQLAPREKTSRSHKQGPRQLTMILVHTKAVSAAKGAEVEINIGAAGCQTPATIAGYSHRSHRVQQYAAHHLTSPLIVS
jgi:hypothetical protein